jgi:hypothetical protein
MALVNGFKWVKQKNTEFGEYRLELEVSKKNAAKLSKLLKLPASCLPD